jgi:hypothetical protein
LLAILALVPAALLPLAAICQIAPASTASDQNKPSYKYEAFLAGGYTSLNQVNQSRFGLVGEKAAITRDFTKHIGVTATGAYYKYATGSGNPGDPSVYSVLAGPEFTVNVWGKFDGMLHGLMGVEHTGGEHMTPNFSFAGGVGGGMIYNWTNRLAIRASGDRIGASFSLNNNSSALAYSSHVSWNARGECGVIYRF